MVLAEIKIYFWKRLKYSFGYRDRDKPTNSHENAAPNLCGKKKFLETKNTMYKHLFEKLLELCNKEET